MSIFNADKLVGASSGTEGVTALALKRDKLVVGGGDGGIKLWSLGRSSISLVKTIR